MLGVQGLSVEDERRVTEANSFIDFTFRSISSALDRNSAAALESPLRSWLWAFPQSRELDKKSIWDEFEYEACSHLGARCKRQLIRSNVEEMSIVRGVCMHLHGSDDWTPVWSPAQGRFYPGSQEAEYTAILAYQIA